MNYLSSISLATFCWNSLIPLVLWQDIELNKAQWSALFEPYLFFEAYKNYLQVDILAADAYDLLAWKGWVESRLRQLTLKVKRFSLWFYKKSMLQYYIIYAFIWLRSLN